MSYPSNAPDESSVCPYLGLGDDADSHATYATEAHRCYRLPNPTRIAPAHQESYCLGANHPSCPVYQGEGVEATTARAAPVPPPFQQEPQQRQQAPQRQQSDPFAAPAPPPQWAEEEAEPYAEEPSQRPLRRPSPGSVGGRTQRGGISMPVATVGLFALAIVVVVIAFFINQQLGDDNGALSPEERFETSQAQTQQAGAGGTPTSPADETPGAETPGPGDTATAEPTEPPAEETPTSPPDNGGGATTYEVQPLDTCSAIAADNGVTLDELLDANGLTEDDCLGLQPGDELIIP